MGFKCGFVGLPNVGKSTLFNALTRLHVEASAYPFCTIHPHFGIVPVEDRRLDMIYRVIGSAKKTPTFLEFVDIAGLVEGASRGEGLGNQFLSHIAMTDAIAQIVRCFEDTQVAHAYSSLDPVRDVQVVTLELILKDMEAVEKALSKAKSASKSGDSLHRLEVEALESMLSHLSAEKEIRTLALSEQQEHLVHTMNLLTAKPQMLIANIDEAQIKGSPLVGRVEAYAGEKGIPCIVICGKIQAEISELDPKDQSAFLQAMGFEETGLEKLIRTGYGLLNLISFFTANQNEAHAWTVPQNTSIRKAAGCVHSDFEEGFIKADVIRCRDLETHGSVHALHELGLVSVHGKEYCIQDGDLVFFHVRG